MTHKKKKLTRKERVKKLASLIGQGVYEKEETIKLMLLSILAGESIFLLGPPGVGKSLVSRRMSNLFKGGKEKHFDILMDRFSEPNSVFGPIKIKELSEKGIYERDVEGFLPTANTAFLDEIFKANSSILNSLLTIINEKVFRNGKKEIKVPLKGVIAASNELPNKDSLDNLDALWDRFLVRYVVQGMGKTESFRSFLGKGKPVDLEVEIGEDWAISDAEFAEWQKQINDIEIPDEVMNVFVFLRGSIAKEEKKYPNPISDRRWKKIARLLRTSAFLNERKQVDLMDCFLISHCLWNTEEEQTGLKKLVRETIQKYGYSQTVDTKDLEVWIENFKDEIESETKATKKVKIKKNKLIDKKYYRIEGMSEKIGYDLILKSDFNSLGQQMNGFYIYDENGNNYYYKIQIKKYGGNKIKSKNHHARNYSRERFDEIEFNLETINGTKDQITTKAPHKAVKESWDKQCEEIFKNIEAKKKKIQDFKNKDLAATKTNLFVDKELSEVVEKSLNDTIRGLNQLSQELEKIQKNYEEIK